MDVVETYLARLENLFTADVGVAVDHRFSTGSVDLATFLSTDAVLADGHLQEWSLTYDPSSRRSRLAAGHMPMLGTQTLGRLVRDGRFEHLERKIRAETVGRRGRSASQRSFRNGYLWKPPWEDGVKVGVLEVSARDLIAASQRTVLLGPLGSGKSTIMRELAREHAARWIHGPPVTAAGSSDPGDGAEQAPAYLPLYIEIRRLALATAAQVRAGHPLTLDVLFAHLADTTEVSRDLVDHALRAWHLGRVLLLLDGLDEIFAALPRQAAERVETALLGLLAGLERRPTANQIIVSSRPRPELPSALADYLPVELAPLTPREGVELIAGARPLDDADRKRISRVLADTPPELHGLPLFVVLVGGLLGGGVLPASLSRASVLDAALHQLTIERPVAKSGHRDLADYLGCTEEALIEGLEKLAFESLPSPTDSRTGLVPGLRVGRLAEVFLDLNDGIQVNTLKTALVSDSGLLVDHGGELSFVHRAFQDTLAAGHLLHLTHRDRSHTALLDRLEPGDEVLRDVAVLYVAKARALGSVNMLLDLCSAALDRAGAGPAERRARFVWLAGVVLSNLRGLPDVGRSRRDTVVIDAFRAVAPHYMGDCGVLPLRDRVAIADQLGWWLDPRDGIGLDAGQRPAVKWIQVPGGRYPVGLDERLAAHARAQGGDQLDRETPATTVVLDAFDIGAYPVTWRQFRGFVDDPGGYRAAEWWFPAAAAFTDSVRSARFATLSARRETGNVPATGVDWFEAIAWCRWASARLGERIDLPTEEEWEAAARGHRGWLFPWGPRFDPDALNWEGSAIGRPIPVGCFASSTAHAPGAPHDMLGNVWEWTRSLAEPGTGPPGGRRLTPVGHAPAPDEPHIPRRRITRGASFLNGRALIRATFRGADDSRIHYQRQGFRVVRRG